MAVRKGRAATMATHKAVVKTVDMIEEMEKDAIEWSMAAMLEYNVESHMAAYVSPAPLNAASNIPRRRAANLTP